MVEAHALTIFCGHSSSCAVCKFVDITETGNELALRREFLKYSFLYSILFTNIRHSKGQTQVSKSGCKAFSNTRSSPVLIMYHGSGT